MNDRIVEAWRRIVMHDETRIEENWVSIYRGNHSAFRWCTWGCGSKCSRCRMTNEELVAAIAGDGNEFESNGLWFKVYLCQWGDYSGSDLDRANGRVFGGMAGVDHEDSWGVHGEGHARMIVGQQPEGMDDDQWADNLEEIADMLDSVQDYPILCESTWSELQCEIADEMWDAYLWLDVRSEIEGMIDDESIDVDEHEDVIREAFYSFEENEWTCETATSAVNLRHDDAVRYAVQEVFGLVPA